MIPADPAGSCTDPQGSFSSTLQEDGPAETTWGEAEQEDDRPRKRKINEACFKLGRCSSFICPLKAHMGAQLTHLLQPRQEEG